MSIVSSIGNTPLVALQALGKASKVRFYAKLEGHNPGGSVKDRPALAMIEAAEREGLLKAGRVILEPTSGNTGISMAMIGAAKGYPVKLCMPACVSEERRKILEAFGAEVVLTPAELSTDGAIIEARRLAAADPDRYFMPDQFSSQHNASAHYRTTGPELWWQTGCEITHFVAGIGTSGTLMGISRFLKEKNPAIQVIGVEPVPGHHIQGLKNLTESMVPAIFDRTRIDRIVQVDDDEAFSATRCLATREGIFAGMSSGAALAGALKALFDADAGTVVVLLPDKGDRYLSTTLFRSVCAKCQP